MPIQPTSRGSQAEQGRTRRASSGRDDHFVGLLLGSGVFFVQVFALVPGLFPFLGLAVIFLLVLALPLLVLGAAAALVAAPFYLVFRLMTRRGR